MDSKKEIDALHALGANAGREDTQHILDEIKLYFQNNINGRYGKVKDTDFEWMITKIERAINFSYKILT